MASHEFDLVVIGSGPAGYVGAIRAAQLGMKVAIIEKESTLGGTCLNVGCIPSKALLDSSEKYSLVKHHLDEHGISVSGAKLDVKKMVARKDNVVKQLTGGIPMLMKKNKITVFNGWGSLKDANTVLVDDGKEELKAKNILIAAGSVPVELPHLKFDGKNIISSTEALSLSAVPKHLVVIGAGVIGLEMGSVWSRLGAEVTLIDVLPRILPVFDEDITKQAHKTYEKQGLKFQLESKVTAAKVGTKGIDVTYEDKDGKSHTIKGDKVLVAVGRKPNTGKLGLDKLGIRTDNRGLIEVDSHYRTSVPNIYAVGDCTPGPMLAHKGEEEAVAAAELMAGKAGHVNYDAIAWIVYTWPEVAAVGMSEKEAKEKGHEVKVGKFPFRINGRALAMGELDGLVKVIADAKTDRMLGMHIFGPNASEMIAEAVVATEFKASAEDVARTVHAHPTLAEVMKEAALAVDGRAIHN